MATRIYVADIGESNDPQQRVVVRVVYGGKTARIEFRRSESLFDGESGAEVYRRDLHELTTALEDWDKSGGPIE